MNLNISIYCTETRNIIPKLRIKNNINFVLRHFNIVFDFLVTLLISYFIFKISDKYFITVLINEEIREE